MHRVYSSITTIISIYISNNTNELIRDVDRANSGDGRVDPMPIEEAKKLQKENKEAETSTEIINDPTTPDDKSDVIVVPSFIAAQIKSTNPTYINIDTGVNGKNAEFIMEYGGYVTVAGVAKKVIYKGGKYLIKKGMKYVEATKSEIKEIKIAPAKI
jgi:hypothetical protein